MQDSVIQWPLGLDSKDLVGAGITAIVARLNAVVNQTSIRQYLARQTKQVPLSLRLRWVEQLIDAVRFIHSRRVLHGDISCNNVFLDNNLNVKLGDFAGSAIDNLPPLICYETSHELPGEDISTRTEQFALGSTTYEIMTGSKPYNDLPDHEVSAAFAKGRYPDLECVSAFKNVITKCWRQSYTSTEEALLDVKLEVAVIKKSRIPRAQILSRPFWFPFLLTTASLIPIVHWAKRWRLHQ
ncbi:kinase-like protein [Byssothecium circinans]|uniref:EKC/KEOPS complex subunit BUD32 n=1 Tax=Byssothecium circinans TaxID=147558 RepID=A0A6A5TW60_9PLEO|nr:kinase-like protein [Byssothecium circinans]